MIHLSDNISRTLVVTCQITEERSRNSHIKRCRYALACHVADDKEQFVVVDDEVIQITAHLLRRRHGGKQFQIITLREGRRNHAHLDIMGNHQLTLKALLASRRYLQVLNMLFQGCLHILKRLA